MARLRYNGLSNSLGAALTSGGTTITFASKLTYAGGDVPTISGSDYIPLSILDADGLCAEVVHLTAYTSAATTGTIARGKEDTSGVAHDNGATFVGGPTAHDGGGHVAWASRASGNATINSTTWVAVTGLDLTVPAIAGDVIDCRMMIRADASSAPYCVLDFHTWVSSAAVNSVTTEGSPGSSPATSHPGWATGNVLTGISGYTWFLGSKLYEVQAGDIDGNSVTLKLRGVSNSAVTLSASDPAAYVEVRNLGQVG